MTKWLRRTIWCGDGGLLARPVHPHAHAGRAAAGRREDGQDAHFIGYAVLGARAVHVIASRRPARPDADGARWSGLIYGAVDEWLQIPIRAEAAS